MDKEAILKEMLAKWTSIRDEYNEWLPIIAPKWRNGETMYTQVQKAFSCIVEDIQKLNSAMESYSTELRKENEELKKRLSDRPSTDQVPCKLDEKDRDILYWKLEAYTKNDTIIEKDKEISELKNDMQTMEEQDKLRCETYEKLIGQMEEQQRTIDELKEGLGKISKMKLENGEIDYKYAFNRCWHIAQSILSKHNSKV